MDHADHVELLRDGVPGPGGLWADLGAGSGAFTLALAELIGPGGQIWAIDKDAQALTKLKTLMNDCYPGVTLALEVADFTRPLHLPPLDGVVMANSLHFLARAAQEATLGQVRDSLKPGGRLLLVEYGTDRGNFWVPHPLSYGAFERLAQRAGFVGTHLLKMRPSRFLGQIYAACAEVSANA